MGRERTFMKLAPAVVATMAMHRALEKGSGGSDGASVEPVRSRRSVSSAGDFSWASGPGSGPGTADGPPASNFSDPGAIIFPSPSSPLEMSPF